MEPLYPSIRFKRFLNNPHFTWETVRLSDVLKERNENRTISPDYPLLSFTIEEGVINPEDKKTNKRDFLIKDKDNKKFAVTEVDDIIYNPANLKFGAIHRNKLCKGVVSPIYAIFSTKEDPAFIEFLVTHPDFIKKTQKYVEGTVVKLMTLKPRDFLKMKVAIPKIDEQKEIASFLEKLDEEITVQSKLIQLLYKRITPLFKKLNSRIKEFDSIEIGKLGKYFSTDALSWEDISDDGSKPAILYGELFTTYDYYVDEVKSKTNKAISSISGNNDILFPTSTTADAVSLIKPVSIKKAGILLGGDMFGIRLPNNIDSDYLSYLINCEYKCKLARYAQGTTIIHLHYEDIKKIQVNVPDIEVQKQIASIMNLEVEKIKIEEKYLAELKKRKQFYMHNLTVQI